MMSEPTPVPAIELPHQGDLAFGALMDALAPDEPTAGPGGTEGAAPAATGGAAAGGAPGGAEAPGAGPATAGQPGGGEAQAPAGALAGAAGSDGDKGPAGAGPAAGGSEQPAADSQPAAVAETGIPVEQILPKISELNTQFEETITKALQRQAYDQAREDYEKYFDALEKHPRLLVGQEVPKIGGEGMETLRTSEDAKEWQEAVRSLLVAEIRDDAQNRMTESRNFLETVHASIDLFKNNPDLIPGVKGFNKTLADRFAEMAKPYEVRDEDDKKLLGYSIPVQPIIDNLRKQMAPAPPPPAPPAAAPVPRATLEPPQAGIPSKAGSSAEREDFSTLFGTIGLPNLQI